MALISGTAILNTGGTGVDNPATNPILVTPANGVTVVGFGFTNTSNTPVTVLLYRNSVLNAPLIAGGTVVPALAGMTGGPAAVTVLLALQLATGETIFALGSIAGVANVEVDGVGAVSAQTIQQLLTALIIQNVELGAGMPDSGMLLPGALVF